MSRLRYSCKFYLKEDILKSKGHPIYCRIILDRRKAEIFTGEYCKKGNWDDEGYPKGNTRLNNKLAKISKEIEDTVNDLETDDRDITAGLIKKVYIGDINLDPELLQFFSDFIEEMVKHPELHHIEKIKHYKTTNIKLEAFLSKEHKMNLRLKRFNRQMIEEFDDFLSKSISEVTKKPLHRNYINKHHSRIKYLLKKARIKGFISMDPYLGFEIENEKVERTFLTAEELEKIEKNTLGGNAGLEKARDIYLWSVYTGMRYSDAMSLEKSAIWQDKKGNYMITFKNHKSDKEHTIPLLNKAVEIFKKHMTEQSITGKVLPRLSNQKINTYLKIIAELTGIKKNLHHHSARHTCATTVLLKNKVPMEVVSKWLDHTKMSTTQIYGKITNDVLVETAHDLNQKIG